MRNCGWWSVLSALIYAWMTHCKGSCKKQMCRQSRHFQWFMLWMWWVAVNFDQFFGEFGGIVVSFGILQLQWWIKKSVTEDKIIDQCRQWWVSQPTHHIVHIHHIVCLIYHILSCTQSVLVDVILTNVSLKRAFSRISIEKWWFEVNSVECRGEFQMLSKFIDEPIHKRLCTHHFVQNSPQKSSAFRSIIVHDFHSAIR